MKISLQWLQEFVDLEETAQQLAEDLTMAGLEVEGIAEVDGDTIFEIGVTPNRPDWLSHLGVSRELAALYGREVRVPEIGVKEGDLPVEAMSSVEIENPDACPRYSARVISGVKLGPAPEKVRLRLEALGVRSINNVVDATNYVMLELGQPLHAFDYHRLRENRIVVRKAIAGEVMNTLDGQKRDLDAGDLLICDGLGPVALAGVMGGENSEVEDDTADLLLESACFDPVTIRKTSKRLGLSTEASYRFERGTDPSATTIAVNRLARLINEWAGGRVCSGVLDIHPRDEGERKVRFRPARINSLLGTEIKVDAMKSILAGLDLGPRKGKGGWWTVSVPGYRRDIVREEDVVEEVARIYGYQNVPVTMPVGRTVPVRPPEQRELILRVKSLLEADGFFETISYSYVSRPELDALGLTGGPEPVKILNPISEEMSVMRVSLLPGLLNSAQFNVSRRVEEIRLYEIGRVFLPCNACNIAEERIRVSGVMAGTRRPKTWYGESEKADFFDVKGVVENLLRGLGIDDISFSEVEMPYLQAGQGAWAMVDNQPVGPVGTLNPDTGERYGIKGWSGCFELDLHRFQDEAMKITPYKAIPKFPEVLRDLALIVPPMVKAGEIEKTAMGTGGNLRAVNVFDEYRGKGVPAGHRSLAFALHFQSPERTLTDEEVDRDMAGILKVLKKKFGVELR